MTERRTKIVCTIGPASSKPEVLSRLIDAGMDVARLNFSHGTLEEHGETIRTVRQLCGHEKQAVGDPAGPAGSEGSSGPVSWRLGDHPRRRSIHIDHPRGGGDRQDRV